MNAPTLARRGILLFVNKQTIINGGVYGTQEPSFSSRSRRFYLDRNRSMSSHRFAPTTWALDQGVPHNLTSSELLTLVGLAGFVNREMACWPSIEAISEKCRITEKTVRKSIEALAKKGLLEIRRRARDTNIYLLKGGNFTSLEGGDSTLVNLTGSILPGSILPLQNDHPNLSTVRKEEKGIPLSPTRASPDPAPSEPEPEPISEPPVRAPEKKISTLVFPHFNAQSAFDNLRTACLGLGLNPGALTPGMRKMLECRLSEVGGENGWWRFLENLREAKFLHPGGGADFSVDGAWLMRPDPFQGVMSGRYSRKKEASKPRGAGLRAHYMPRERWA